MDNKYALNLTRIHTKNKTKNTNKDWKVESYYETVRKRQAIDIILFFTC